MQLLKLAHNCLNFDFIGTSTDESSDDLCTVQIPTSWRSGDFYTSISIHPWDDNFIALVFQKKKPFNKIKHLIDFVIDLIYWLNLIDPPHHTHARTHTHQVSVWHDCDSFLGWVRNDKTGCSLETSSCIKALLSAVTNLVTFQWFYLTIYWINDAYSQVRTLSWNIGLVSQGL